VTKEGVTGQDATTPKREEDGASGAIGVSARGLVESLSGTVRVVSSFRNDSIHPENIKLLGAFFSITVISFGEGLGDNKSE
jgi:hypothetical protein